MRERREVQRWEDGRWSESTDADGKLFQVKVWVNGSDYPFTIEQPLSGTTLATPISGVERPTDADWAAIAMANIKDQIADGCLDDWDHCVVKRLDSIPYQNLDSLALNARLL